MRASLSKRTEAWAVSTLWRIRKLVQAPKIRKQAMQALLGTFPKATDCWLLKVSPALFSTAVLSPNSYRTYLQVCNTLCKTWARRASLSCEKACLLDEYASNFEQSVLKLRATSMGCTASTRNSIHEVMVNIGLVTMHELEQNGYRSQ